MKIQKHVLLIWLVWSVVQIAGAESLHKLTSYKRYIHEYKSLAIEQQHKYKIPASITLAQGLLESGAGQSDLARRSNNHFGIKCHDWKGEACLSRRRPSWRMFPQIQQRKRFIRRSFQIPGSPSALCLFVPPKYPRLQRLGQRIAEMRLCNRPEICQ